MAELNFFGRMRIAPGLFHARISTSHSFQQDVAKVFEYDIFMVDMLSISRIRISWTVAALILTLSACGSSSRLNYDSPEEAFNKGKEYYDAGDYARATEYLQGAFDFGRTHQWAADAQLYLARAYRGNREFLLAANEFARFTQIYRSDPRVPDAEYELAMTYFYRSPKFDMDQTDTERAINQFRLFMNRYSEHPLVLEAQQRVRELREKLAQKQFSIAKLYERRGLYHAAALSFESVFDKYYDSTWADDALLGAMKMYFEYGKQSIAGRQNERFQKAIDNYDRLRQIFPDSPIVREAEALYLVINQTMEGLQQGS